MSKDNETHGPITTDLLGAKVWTCGSGWATVRAMFYQNIYGFSFLVEDNEGQLTECNYGDAFTKEPVD